MALQELLLQLPSPLDAIPVWAFLLYIAWEYIWKGISLWKSARLNQPVWFVLLLLVNDFGILQILYVYVFSKLGFDHLGSRKSPKKKK